MTYLVVLRSFDEFFDVHINIQMTNIKIPYNSRKLELKIKCMLKIMDFDLIFDMLF